MPIRIRVKSDLPAYQVAVDGEVLDFIDGEATCEPSPGKHQLAWSGTGVPGQEIRLRVAHGDVVLSDVTAQISQGEVGTAGVTWFQTTIDPIDPWPKN